MNLTVPPQRYRSTIDGPIRAAVPQVIGKALTDEGEIAMSVCKEQHRYSELFADLPPSQAGSGRHKCAGCAYNRGIEDGLAQKEHIDLDLDGLPDSQAGNVRHQSPHAAWAMGYLEGVRRSYK